MIVRKLMWFTIGFSAAAAICAYFLSGIWLLISAIAGCVAFIVFLILRKRIHPVLFVVLMGLCFGLLYNWGYDTLLLSAAKDYDGAALPVEVQATDYSFETGYGAGVDGKVSVNGKVFRTRLYFQGEQSVKPGDRIRINAKLRYTPTGGLQTATYHKGEGIFLLAYGQSEPVLIENNGFQMRFLSSYFRKGICERIMDVFPDDTAAFAKALLIGDDSDISFGDNIAFQKSGIRHVIAVSGLHVSILFSLIYYVTRKNRFLSMLIGLPVLLLFAAVAGFSPSIVRACVMQALMILAMVLDREYDPGTSLSFACFVMLTVNPLTITSVNFQLSVGCMIGIFLFSGRIRDYFAGKITHKNPKSIKAKLIRWLTTSVSVSISAMIFTMPLCAIYFDMVTVIGIVTNLLVLWVITYIFCGIIVACLLSLLWMPAGYVVALLVSWLIRYVLMVSRLLAAIPGGAAYSDSPYTVLWIVTTIILIALYFIIKRKFPTLLASIIASLYLLSLTISWAIPRLYNVQVTVMDVGQGQCVLIQNKDRAYMIDCGGSDPKRTATTAINAMGAQGIHRLDGLILTHYDEDHCNGASYLLEVIPVEQLYLPDAEPENEIRRLLERSDVPITWVTENRSVRLESGYLRIFPGISGATGNESSMCILFQSKNCDILITGDRSISGENLLLEQNSIPELELLVAGHHGAETSTGEELLRICSPETVAISAGKGNIHQHPNDATLERLKIAGCLIRRTDLEGTIIFRR